MTAARAEVLRRTAAVVTAGSPDRPLLVGVDGVDGVGKTVFADELADVLRDVGRQVVRVSIDGFHNPRAVRYARGRKSPEGFFHDSYDVEMFIARVVAPLRPGGSRAVQTAAFDHATDRPVSPEPVLVRDGGVVLVDGIFLHRDELAGVWDASVLLVAPWAATYARMADRDGSDPDPDHPANRRYLLGQQLYLESCSPEDRATLVIDNSDLAAPAVLRTV